MVTSSTLSRWRALMTRLSSVLPTVSQTWVGRTTTRGVSIKSLFLLDSPCFCRICTGRWWWCICVVFVFVYALYCIVLDRNLYLLGILFPIVCGAVHGHGSHPAPLDSGHTRQTIRFRLYYKLWYHIVHCILLNWCCSFIAKIAHFSTMSPCLVQQWRFQCSFEQNLKALCFLLLFKVGF